MLLSPRPALSSLLALSMAAAPFPQAFAGAPAVATRAGYEACQAGDEESFRKAVETIVNGALEREIKRIDYPAVIADEWRRLGLDQIVDKRVDLAVEEVKAETSWSGLAQSLVNKEKAQALATAVAERVYRSDDMKTAIEGLATGAGKEIGKSIERGTEQAAGPTLECLRLFLGPRYGTTIASAVTGEAERDFGFDVSKGGAGVASGSVLKQSSEGLTGAAILLLRRQLANMAARIGQRLAGSVLSRLVSVAAGGVGLVLIAKDIWELRNGVLPIIADEMKSASAKDSVKAELAKAISEQIGEHVHEIGAKTAERVTQIWQDFRRAHTKALELAEKNAAFRSFIDTVKPEALPRLDEVVAIILGSEGEAGVLARLDNGTLNEAVRFMPEAAMTIARDTRSIDTALKWSELAGDRLGKVVELGLYQRGSPDDFTRASLDRLFALDDTLAITRLSALPREARTTLLDLDTQQLRELARNLSEAELTTLAGYLTGLEKGPRDRVLAAVASAPGKMQILAPQRVRAAVVASADQSAAVDMMLRDSGTSIDVVAADFVAAWEGRVSPVLLWDRHPFVIALSGLLALLLLLMLRRLLSPRRPQAA